MPHLVSTTNQLLLTSSFWNDEVILYTAICLLSFTTMYYIYCLWKSKIKRKQAHNIVYKIPIPIALINPSNTGVQVNWTNRNADVMRSDYLKETPSNEVVTNKYNLQEACAEAMQSNEMVVFENCLFSGKYYKVYLKKIKVNKREQVVCTVADITEVKKLQQEAKINDAKMDDFIKSISHEVRTPLNAILGFSQLLMDMPIEERHDVALLIKEKSFQLHKLINDIILLANLQRGCVQENKSTFYLNEWLEQIAAFYQLNHVDNTKVKLTYFPMCSCCKIHADKQLLFTLIHNILGNAVKFTAEGDINMGMVEYENQYILCVQDSGIGMDKDKLMWIFKTFTKVDMFTQGTGLGMPICKELAELLGGHIGIYSEKGVGTTVLYVIQKSDKHTLHMPPADEVIKLQIQCAQWVHQY